jgi:hypothetical protein
MVAFRLFGWGFLFGSSAVVAVGYFGFSAAVEVTEPISAAIASHSQPEPARASRGQPYLFCTSDRTPSENTISTVRPFVTMTSPGLRTNAMISPLFASRTIAIG